MSNDDLFTFSREEMIEIFGTDNLEEAQKRHRKFALAIKKVKKAIRNKDFDAAEAALREFESEPNEG